MMNKSNEILLKNNSINRIPISIKLIILVCILPIFLNLNIFNGLRFDANPFIKLGAPSLPISSFFVLILVLFNIRIFIENKVYLFFLMSTFLITLFTFSLGNTRIIIIFFQMNILFISYYSFVNIFTRYNIIDLYNIFFRIICVVILLKFSCDTFMYKTIITPFFLNENIMIYNYYDYFPFLYLLGVVLAVGNLRMKRTCFLSLLILVISSISLVLTNSRLFTYSLFLFPFLFIFYKLIKINKKIVFLLYFLVVILITIIFSIYPNIFNENSLSTRFGYWSNFFNSFEIKDIFFPFSNEYRLSSNMSFHNELLEIVSFFGFIGVLYFYLLFKMFMNAVPEYNFVLKMILFPLIIGMTIQLNILNPYISVLLALFLSIIKFRSSENYVQYKSINVI